MGLLPLFFISIVPGAFWVWYFYRQDHLDPEPWWLVLKSYLVGALAVIPVSIVERPLAPYLSHGANPLVAIILSIAIIGVTEEFFKFLAAYVSVYRQKDFNEVMDGIIYVVTAGLGFATVENLFYAAAYGLRVGAVRAILTSLAHAGFSGIVGFYFGMARCHPERRGFYIFIGLTQAAILHGLYDYFIMNGIFNFTMAVLSVIVLQIYLGRLINRSEELSPFRR